MIIEELCGEKLWDNETIYSQNPDFTNCFENTVLIWLPCLILWIISPIWIYMLTKHNQPKINLSFIIITKIILTSILISIEVTNIYRAYTEQYKSAIQFISPLVLIITYILSMILTNYERYKGLNTSSLLFTFWSLLTLTSCIRLRSVILKYSNEPNEKDIITLVTFFVFFCVLVLNLILSVFCLSKKSLTDTNGSKILPENRVYLLSKLWFWWLNDLILIGFKRDITRDDLWLIEEKESSDYNTNRFEKIWKKDADEYIMYIRKNEEIEKVQRNSKNKNTKNEEEEIALNQVDVAYKGTKKKPSFGLAVIKVFKGKFLAGSMLKLIYDLFQFAGPMILDKLIKFIKEKEQNILVGLFLTLLLFFCSLIQSFVLQHYFHRMFIVGARIRTTIMNTVYKKSLKLSASARKQATVGEMTNLIAVNAQTVAELTTYLNVLWSSPLQITIAIYLLVQYLGVAALLGVATMIIFIPINLILANRVKKLQTAKLKIQDSRIKMMNEILSGMKVIKFYGWELSFQNIVQQIRKEELDCFKKIGLYNVATSFTWTCAPLVVSIVSFAAFVLLDDKNVLDASTAFVSLSLFNILRFPMTVLPGIISALINANVSLKRIRDFLLKDEIDTTGTTNEVTPGTSILIKDVDLGFDNTTAYLKNLNLEVKQGELIAIVGEVGSGKSSLLSAILGEMYKLNNGTFNVNGSSAYVSQQAWIQNATVKDNILFGKEYDEKIYNEIIQASCLATDLNIMPASDLTEIGEKGINLSGGQKQRISLARSLYSNSDIYFLDDPLSAVDSHVGKDLFDNVIGPNGLLNKKTRLFVTNSLSFLSQVDRIIMMHNGMIMEIGSYDELLRSAGKFSEFIRLYLNAKKSNQDDKVNESTEKTAKIKEIIQVKSKTEVAGEKIIVKEKIESGKVKKSVFTTYFKACGYGLTIISFCLFGLTSLAQLSSNLWLSHWSNDSQNNINSTENEDNKIYGLLVFVLLGGVQCIIALCTESFYLFFVLNGAKILHNKMLRSILRSTMEFFESTPSGRIINRFSKDVEATERGIPDSFKTLQRWAFQVFTTVVVISVSTPYFMIVLVPIVIIYILIQRYFVASMRQLKRMDTASKSPIFSHFSESLSGVSSIRAYKVENRFIKEMFHRVDENLLYYFPNNISNRWLALRLELVGNLITVFSALFAVIARDSISAGVAALSITYSLNISTTLNCMVRRIAEFETNITSAERIEEYSNNPQEGEWNSMNTPSLDWPNQGKIVFDKYCVKYRETLDNVLNDIDVIINPGEKIGIVGRTGAGKSSLSLALFRILEYSTGKILIDDVDIRTIGLHELRHKLTIIPQDPVLFSGTLRINLDPFKSYSDDKIWKALESAHLKTFVQTLENGLEFECSEGGENMSVGQRQLVCLARALLRKTKILLLDEATASVDHNTDELIQNTIREEFSDCTILTVAHRLNTIMDSSRIMVLEKGRIVEFETPDELIKDNESIFHSMAKNAGII